MSHRSRHMGRLQAQTEQDFQQAIQPQYTASMPPPTMAQMNTQGNVPSQPIQPKQVIQQPPAPVFFQPATNPSEQNVVSQQPVSDVQQPQNNDLGVFDIFKPQGGAEQSFQPPQVNNPPQQKGFSLFGKQNAKQPPPPPQNILGQTGAPLTTPATQLNDNQANRRPIDPPIVTPSQPIQQLEIIKQQQETQMQQLQTENLQTEPNPLQYIPAPGISNFFDPPTSNRQQQLMEEAIPQAQKHGDILDNFSDSNLDHLGIPKPKIEQDNQLNAQENINKQNITSKENTEMADQQSSMTQSQANAIRLNQNNQDQSALGNIQMQNCNVCGCQCLGLLCQKCYKAITDENQSLKNQVSELNNKVTYFEMENTGIQEQYDTLYPKYQEVEQQVINLKHQLETVTDENDKLKKQTVTAQDNISVQQFNQQKLEFNREIQKKSEQIQKLIIEQQNREQEYSAQQQQIEQLQEQIRRHGQADDTIEKLQANLTTKSEEAVKLQYQIQQSSSKISKLEQQINDHIKEINALQSENTAKDDQLKRLEAEKENIKKEIDSIQMQFDEQVDLNEKNQAQISKYEAQLSENKTQITNIQRTQQENMHLKKELLELQRNKFQHLPQVSRQERVNHYAMELSLKKTEFPLTSMNEHLLLQDLSEMTTAESNVRLNRDQDIKNSGDSLRRLNLPSHLELMMQLLHTKLDPTQLRPLIRNLLTGIFDEFEGKTPKSEIIIQIQLFLLSGEIQEAIQLAKENNMYDLVYYLLIRDEQNENLKEQHENYVNFIRLSNGFEYFESSPRQLLEKFMQYGDSQNTNGLVATQNTQPIVNTGYYEIGLGLSCLLLGESEVGEFLDMIGKRYMVWGAPERQFAAMCVGFPLLARSSFEYVELNASDVSFRLKQRFIPRAVRHLASQYRMPLQTNWVASLIYQYITGRIKALQQLHSVKLSNKVCTADQSPNRSPSLEKSVSVSRKDDILSYENISSDPDAVHRLYGQMSQYFINTYKANENDLQGDLCDISCLAHVSHTKKPSNDSPAKKSSNSNQQQSPKQSKGWDVGGSSSSSDESQQNDDYSESYSSSSTGGEWLEDLQHFKAPEKPKFESFLPDSYYQLRGWPHVMLYDIAICVWLGRSSSNSEERLYSWTALQLARKGIDQIIGTAGAAGAAKCDESLLVREFPFGLSARDCLFAQTPRAAGLFGDVRNRLDSFLTRLGTEPAGIDTHKLKRFADAFYNDLNIEEPKKSLHQQSGSPLHPQYQQSSILATSDVRTNGAVSPQLQQFEKINSFQQQLHTLPAYQNTDVPRTVQQMPKLHTDEQPQNQAPEPSVNVTHNSQLKSQVQIETQSSQQAGINDSLQYFPPPMIQQPPIYQPVKVSQNEEDIEPGLKPMQQTDLLRDPLPNIESQEDENKHDPDVIQPVQQQVPQVPMPVPIPLTNVSPPQPSGGAGRNTRRRQLSGNQAPSQPQAQPQPLISIPPPVFVPEIVAQQTETPEPQIPGMYEKEESSSSEFDNNEPEDAYDINNLMKVNESTRLKEQMYEVPKALAQNIEQPKQQKSKEKKGKDKKDKLQPAQGKKLSRKYSEKYKQWVQVDKDGNEIPPENIEQVAPPPMAPGFG